MIRCKKSDKYKIDGNTGIEGCLDQTAPNLYFADNQFLSEWLRKFLKYGVHGILIFIYFNCLYLGCKVNQAITLNSLNFCS